MNRKDNQNYQMLTCVVDYGTRNVGLFPKNTTAAEILRKLESEVKTLSEIAANRKSAEAAMHNGHAARLTARDNARNLIIRAGLVARALNTGKVRLPKKKTERELIDVGRGVGRDAESLKKDFARFGLQPEQVSAAVEALETAILDYTKAKTNRSAAIEEWNSAMAAAMEALAGFDALVANVLGDNPGALASYQAIRSIGRFRGRKAAVKTPPAVDPQPAVVPVAPVAPVIPIVPATTNAATA